MKTVVSIPLDGTQPVADFYVPPPQLCRGLPRDAPKPQPVSLLHDYQKEVMRRIADSFGISYDLLSQDYNRMTRAEAYAKLDKYRSRYGKVGEGQEGVLTRLDKP